MSNMHYENCGPTPADCLCVFTPQGVVQLLTPAELRAMELTTELFNLVSLEVIGHDVTRENDHRDFTDNIHQIQRMLLSQAAGRAYPNRFRTLGEVIKKEAKPFNMDEYRNWQDKFSKSERGE